MPYTMEWDGRGLIKRLSGYVSAHEFSKSAEATTSHPEFDRAKYVINDFADTSGTDLGDALEYVAIIRIGASLSKPTLRVAYVGNDEQIKSFISSLKSQAYKCGWDTEAFTTLADAIGWCTAARS